jgi:hypothetical protein
VDNEPQNEVGVDLPQLSPATPRKPTPAVACRSCVLLPFLTQSAVFFVVGSGVDANLVLRLRR